MDHNGFWSLIEGARSASGGDCDRQVDALAEALQGHPPPAILDFRNLLGELLDRTYRYDLWGAAYLINGGCSNDGFDYFLGWLIAQGRDVYQAALQDPDSLVSHPLVASLDPRYHSLWCEGMLSVHERAYEAVTGQGAPAAPDAEVAAAADSAGPTGEDFDFEDPEQLRRRYPRLWARFGWE
jgi:hypothetical protein